MRSAVNIEALFMTLSLSSCGLVAATSDKVHIQLRSDETKGCSRPSFALKTHWLTNGSMMPFTEP